VSQNRYLVPQYLLRGVVQSHPASHSPAAASSLGALEIRYCPYPLPLVSHLGEFVPANSTYRRRGMKNQPKSISCDVFAGILACKNRISTFFFLLLKLH
jgi:hypothetical protein